MNEVISHVVEVDSETIHIRDRNEHRNAVVDFVKVELAPKKADGKLDTGYAD